MYTKVLVCFLSCLVLFGCGANHYGTGKTYLKQENYDQATENLLQAVSQKPEEAENWRQLGIAYYKKGEWGRALDALKKADLIEPDHKAKFYLGLVYEQKEDLDSAIKAYKEYLLLRPKAEMTKKVKTRMKILLDSKMKEEIRQTLLEEKSLYLARIPSNTVAVADFDASGLDPSLAVLRKGLAEFLTTDLSKAEKLRVVERLKIERLLRKLEFGRTEYLEQSTAPRVGRLLGAFHVVVGLLSGVDEKKLRIGSGLVFTQTGEMIALSDTVGEVEQFFKLEKELAFNIIQKTGVALTREEREEIEKVPTESFSAILAYSWGLDYLERGMYTKAKVEFAKAISEDPNFREARNQQQEVKDLIEHRASVADLSSFEMAYEKLEREEIAAREALEARLRQTHGNARLIQDLSADNPHTPPPPPTGTLLIEGDLRKR
jgi:tetratricopeptide (TPR) repeat protein